MRKTKPADKLSFDDLNTILLLTGMTIQHQNQLYISLKPFFLRFFDENEELFHDFYLKVIEKRHKINPEKNIYNWLHTMANNLKIDNFNREKRQINTISFDSINSMAYNNESSYSNIKERFEAQLSLSFFQDEIEEEQKKVVEQAFRCLNEKDRTFVEDYYLVPGKKTQLQYLQMYRIMNKIKKKTQFKNE